MNTDHDLDLDRRLTALLTPGPTELPDASFDAVRDRIDQTGQRVVIGPWRLPDMNKFVSLGLGAAAVVVALVIGAQFLASPGGVGGTPSAEPTAIPSPTSVGGTVEYIGDGIPSTTEVNAVADGASVSGTAVSTSARGTHTVGLECAARDGDTWAFGGTVEQSTAEAGSAGSWSAVLVRDGSPQLIGIWLSDDKVEGIDCDGWLGAVDMASVDASNFWPIESGTLVPPPDLAP